MPTEGEHCAARHENHLEGDQAGAPVVREPNAGALGHPPAEIDDVVHEPDDGEDAPKGREAGAVVARVEPALEAFKGSRSCAHRLCRCC